MAALTLFTSQGVAAPVQFDEALYLHANFRHVGRMNDILNKNGYLNIL